MRWLYILLLCACSQQRVADTDGTYFPWDDRRVLCAVGIDDVSGNDIENLADGLDRAAARGEVISLFGHKPGVDAPIAKLEAILDQASALGLRFFTFADLADPDTTPAGGLALTFDDAGVSEWFDTRELLARRGARVTYFVTRFHRLSDAKIDMLRALEADGHAIEFHARDHLDAPDYVEAHGMQAYLDDEILPGLDDMRSAGFSPTSFAYPFGSRTSALDRALLDHFTLLRSVSFTIGAPLASDPCPH